MVEQNTDPANQGDMPAIEIGEADLEHINTYLASTCFTLLDINKDLFYKELHLPENQKQLKSFASEKSQRAILIAKVDHRAKDAIGEGEEEGGAQNQSPTKASTSADNANDGAQIELNFSLQVEHLGNNAHTLAFLKREPYSVLDLAQGSDQPPDLSNQLQVINLGYIGEDASIFEVASTYVEYSFLPLFHSYKQAPGSQTEAGKSSTGGLEYIIKNLSELKMHLAQCQQNLDIPDVELIIDHDIKNKAEEAKKNDQILKVEDFENQLEDNDFLNRLQKCVEQWYRDIRKVSQKDHDIKTGSTLKEINFWLQMERSLTYIKEQINRNEVQLTLNILAQAQRFRAVMSFKHDTDLDGKLKKAKDYNKLLRDFPINNLLSANDLDTIRKSMEAIFAQLKKLRQQDAYPMTRAMLLYEALSRDLRQQMLKVIQS